MESARLVAGGARSTDLEDFTYTRGCVTDVYYAAAGWGEQPLRYWLDSRETNRRIAHLNELYGTVGITAGGRSHDIDFDTMFTDDPKPAAV